MATALEHRAPQLTAKAELKRVAVDPMHVRRRRASRSRSLSWPRRFSRRCAGTPTTGGCGGRDTGPVCHPSTRDRSLPCENPRVPPPRCSFDAVSPLQWTRRERLLRLHQDADVARLGAQAVANSAYRDNQQVCSPQSWNCPAVGTRADRRHPNRYDGESLRCLAINLNLSVSLPSASV